MRADDGADGDGREPVATADGSATLYSPRYGQTYHSHHGAVTESAWVFVEGSGVGRRLRAGGAVRVLEVGFGTGLNFLLTADLARGAGAPLRYRALERDPLPGGTIRRLGYDRHLKHPTLVDELVAWLDRSEAVGTAAEPRRLHVGTPRCPCELVLDVGDATEADVGSGAFDAVYHDAFSPDANPELWAEPFLARLVAALAPGGALVTYTVKGTVRRALTALGLHVEKRPGPPGGKREMLWARVPGPAR